MPNIHPDASVATTAVVEGDVHIGAGTVVLHGAVITAQGGAVRVAEECVIMECAVVRGVPGNDCAIGDAVLVGPHAHLTGCIVEDGAFLATRSSIFNGARIGSEAEIRIGGVLHVNSRLEAGATIPIGWVAVGDPAEILPPSQHDAIWAMQKRLDFPGTVFRSDRSDSRVARTARYARSLRRRQLDGG